MKYFTLTLILILSCLAAPHARASELPDELTGYLPPSAVSAAQEGAEGLFAAGLSALWSDLRAAVLAPVRRALRSSLRLCLAALLCAAAQGFGAAAGPRGADDVAVFGALAITSLAAGDLTALIGKGVNTVAALDELSSVLLPLVAASLAAGGHAGTAAALQSATMLACDILLSAASGLLVPLVYCFIGASAAGAILPESPLDRLAHGIKKLASGLLSGAMLLFTGWLSVSGIISGSADRTAVRAAKAAISHAVPVVGDIIADASAVLLAGADTLRALLGTAGLLAVLGVCLVPLAELGIEYLFYQAAAFFASAAGLRRLDTLIARLGEAFALMLGMAGAAALVLGVSMGMAVAVVTP